jgi:hypothetical protein
MRSGDRRIKAVAVAAAVVAAAAVAAAAVVAAAVVAAAVRGTTATVDKVNRRTRAKVSLRDNLRRDRASRPHILLRRVKDSRHQEVKVNPRDSLHRRDSRPGLRHKMLPAVQRRPRSRRARRRMARRRPTRTAARRRDR